VTTTTIEPARAVLTSGSAHEDVHILGQLLGEAGHANSTSEGRNPFGIVDDTILTAVARYRAANDVPAEDTIPGVVAHEAGRWIGPALWDAIAPVEREPESDEQRVEREQREAEAKRARAEQLRAELAELEPEPERGW
jgi:hypothetical protein